MVVRHFIHKLNIYYMYLCVGSSKCTGTCCERTHEWLQNNFKCYIFLCVQPLKSRNWVIFRLFKWNKYLHIDTTDQAKAKVEKKLNLWNFDHIIHYIMFNFLLSIIFCSFFNCLLACELIINRVICVVFNLWCENMSILYQ